MSPLLRRWLTLCFITILALSALWHLTDLSRITSFGVPTRPTLKPIDWTKVTQHYPIETLIELPTGQAVSIPKIQAEFPNESADYRNERLKRRDAVKEAFVHSWRGYSKYAWLHDEVAPITRGSKDPFGGWGASLVDSLDTLWVMGLQKDFAIAVAALEKIDFTTATLDTINVFETTIRYLGGLLAAHDLCEGKYPILMEKALQVGEMLYVAFDTPNRLPVTRWWWKLAVQGEKQEAQPHALSAEIGSLTVEFTRLSQLTGNPKWFDAVQRITNALEAQQTETHIPGLWPIVFNAASGVFTTDTTFTMGGMSDSLYEYLPKEYLLLGGLSPQYRSMYESVIEAAKRHLFFRPQTLDNANILLSGTVQKRIGPDDVKLDPESQHLTCFLGGMVATASKIFNRPQDLDVAQKLVDGCTWAYNATDTGISPELFRMVPCISSDFCSWDQDSWYAGVNIRQASVDSSIAPKDPNERAEMLIKQERLPPGFTDIRDRRYILRPEAIESVFILYRITGDIRYQETAWRMFNAITEATKTSISFAAISDVTHKGSAQIDSSESFWMAETLKYFYLIFSEPELISLDEYVLNTEAHPLKRPQS
ncbi:putative endoplasmic reticulum mannosyl-oligosaccharide 1,2-alpha-mannosidase [Tothia fuscella]|uniref:alpha-1,2-Mannosidase n=1 Tax=Tothia fuscella TaxID=1048955 RepID=A0A9P4TSI3_9PEZI|nr:putative endoplasmic reticulum mannosyl-oligosaccharide 1,2-alpha-mannosidase [Tothia fuscella]